ncbi:DsbA family protein [Aeromicrobium sp. CF3.5]|uniref:DsbA family protein n=1 Tax=Aeromicrobium sp. CF3.5 TaxID=3373078 RepID=UPI003EE54BFF
MSHRISPQHRITLVVVLAAVAVLASIVVYEVLKQPEPSSAAPTGALVRADSHRLGEAEDDNVTLVEFLDFECEACRAAYPFVEDLRETYDGQVTFVVRYFPIDSHVNARNAAHAVEAASRQGRFEGMYAQMYETQAQWGERQESQAVLFRGFAQDLGLDMAQFNADVDSPEVAERVQRDVDDGLALGVSGTPTFFLDGEILQPDTTEEFTDAIDAALAR